MALAWGGYTFNTMKRSARSCYVYAYLRGKDSCHGLKFSPYYIGKGSGSRAYSSDRTIGRPRDNSFIVFLEEELTEQEAFALEKYAIATYGRIDKGSGMLWNKTDGGEGASGQIIPQHVREKIAATLRGRKQPPEVIAKISQSKKGSKHSEETKIKMSRARLGKKRVPHTEEAKLKISQNKAKYEYEVRDPDGNTYTTQSLNKFCKEHGLHQAHMSATAHGEASGYRGWQVRIVRDLRTIPSENELDHQWHTSDEVKAQRKEQKRLYDKARYEQKGRR